MASFNSHSFRYRGQGGVTFPIWDKRDMTNVKERPNAVPAVHSIGADVQRLDAVIRCTKAQLTALYGDVLVTGSLILAWETHNAFLESIDSAFLVVSGQDVYEATLHLIRQ